MKVQHQHHNGEDHAQNGGFGQQAFEEAGHRGAGALGGAGALDKHNGHRLEKAGVSQVIDHHIGEARVAKELGTDRKADKQHVGQSRHGHKHAPAVVGDVEQLGQSHGQQQGQQDAHHGRKQHKARLQQHVVAQVGQQAGNAGAGHGDVDDVLA